LSVLSELNVGETGVLVALDLPESVQNHLMHMGFVPDALVTALRRAPPATPRFMASTAWRLPCGTRPLEPSVSGPPTPKALKTRKLQNYLRPRDERVLRPSGL